MRFNSQCKSESIELWEETISTHRAFPYSDIATKRRYGSPFMWESPGMKCYCESKNCRLIRSKLRPISVGNCIILTHSLGVGAQYWSGKARSLKMTPWASIEPVTHRKWVEKCIWEDGQTIVDFLPHYLNFDPALMLTASWLCSRLWPLSLAWLEDAWDQFFLSYCESNGGITQKDDPQPLTVI